MSIKGLFIVLLVIIVALIVIAGLAIQGLIDQTVLPAAQVTATYGARELFAQLTSQAALP